MNTHEMFRIQAFRGAANRLPKEIGFLPYIQAYIVSGGVDPVDFVEVQEYNPPPGFDYQAFLLFRCEQSFGLDAREEIKNTVCDRTVLRLVQFRSNSL